MSDERIRLDVHAHLAPASTGLAGGGLEAIDGAAWHADKGVMVVDGHTIGMKPLFRPEALIAWMAENRVDQTWISIPPPLYRQHLRGAAAAAWSDYLNDGLQAVAAQHPGHLRALVHLPIETPEAAAAVAARWVAKGHARFSAPAGGTQGQMLSDPAYAGLWRVLDAAGAFLLLHPGDSTDPRVEPFYLGNLLGNPYETALAACHLVFGGVPSAYPQITFCLAHGGGVAGMLAGRLAQGFATDRPGLDLSLPPPRDLLRRLWVDCILHDDGAIALAEQVFGTDHVVFGSDWPFPMGLMTPHSQLAGVPAASRERLLSHNPDAIEKGSAR